MKRKTDCFIMINIVLLGLNHTTAEVALRECLALSTEDTSNALSTFKQSDNIIENSIISTCNRVEILITTKDPQKAITYLKAFLSQTKSIPIEKFEKSLYIHVGNAAIKHIFRVAASLDSMVLGEPQILGQIKSAYRKSSEIKTSGVILNRLFHRAFFVAKRIRTETGIGSSAVSISYAAIELGRKIFGSLENKTVLLIGAGEMAELAVEHLIRNKVSKIQVANRTFKNGVALAKRFSGEALQFEEIKDCLAYVDIIISSTGATNYIVTRDQVKASMRHRKNKPIFLIDIAVPRNIDPTINKLTNAYVYDIDDLKGVIDSNIQERNKEAVKAERLVDEAVLHFEKWQKSLDVVPTIVSLRDKLKKIAECELKKTLNSLSHLKESDLNAIEKMTESMINKFMHHPTLFLKNEGCKEDKISYLDVTNKLFKL